MAVGGSYVLGVGWKLGVALCVVAATKAAEFVQARRGVRKHVTV